MSRSDLHLICASQVYMYQLQLLYSRLVGHPGNFRSTKSLVAQPVRKRLHQSSSSHSWFGVRRDVERGEHCHVCEYGPANRGPFRGDNQSSAKVEARGWNGQVEEQKKRKQVSEHFEQRQPHKILAIIILGQSLTGFCGFRGF